MHVGAFVASVGVKGIGHVGVAVARAAGGIVVGVVVSDNDELDGWTRRCRNYLYVRTVISAG